MIKIKTFASTINTFSDDLDERVNGWLYEMELRVVIKEFKYSNSDKYKSVCVIYEEVGDYD